MKLLSYAIYLILVFLPSDKFVIVETTISSQDYIDSMPIIFKNGLLFFSEEKGNEAEYFDRLTNKLHYADIIEHESLDEPVKVKIDTEIELHGLFPGEYVEASDELFLSGSDLSSLDKMKFEGLIPFVIYKAKIHDLTVSNLEILSICEPNISYANPTFSKDGLTMILSSNKNGQFDLYEYARASYEDEWRLKRNISEVNTENIETFPTLYNDSLLLYSTLNEEQSTGLDIFSSRKSATGEWSTPEKFEPLNTVHDEFRVVFTNPTSGYFCSDRNGSDNIFYFDIRK